jgi:hypothetical protein
MSYKSREKKRAIAAAKFKHRDVMAGRWYLTIVKRTTCCARHGGILRPGMDMVYRHTPREALCISCADSDPLVSYRPSLRWERSKRVKTREGAA